MEISLEEAPLEIKEAQSVLFWKYYNRTVIMEITHKIWASFKTLVSKKAPAWRLKQSQSNDKLLWKVKSSGYEIW